MAENENADITAELLDETVRTAKHIQSTFAEMVRDQFDAMVLYAIHQAKIFAEQVRTEDKEDPDGDPFMLRDVRDDILRFLLFCWDAGVLSQETKDKIRDLAKLLAKPEYLGEDFTQDSFVVDYDPRDDWDLPYALRAWADTAADYLKRSKSS